MKVKIAIVVFIIVVLVVIYFSDNISSYFRIMKLSSQQKKFLKEINPQARLIFASFIDAFQQATGKDVYITSSYRSFEEQEFLHDLNSANAKAGNSYHNYGLAIDLNVVDNGVFVLTKKSEKTDWLNSGIVNFASDFGLRWGGNFSNYYDPVHFDMGNYFSISELKGLALSLFGSDISNIKGNKLNLVV